MNQKNFGQKKCYENLVLLGKKRDSVNTEASDNQLVSEIAESLKINMNFEYQRIDNQNTEGEWLFQIMCETENMKGANLQKAKALKENVSIRKFQLGSYTTRSNQNPARKKK